VVAAAGYGKTTSVRRWLARSPANWTVLDEPTPEQLQVLADRLVDGHQVVVTARQPLPTLPASWRGTGAVVERGPADLALTPAATADLLRRDHGLRDPDLAGRVRDVTAGWPALVRLAGAALSSGPAGVENLPALLAGPGSPVAAYLDAEVLAPLPAPARRLLRDLAGLGPVTGELCRAIGHRRSAEALGLLVRTGLLVGARSPGAPAWRVVPLLEHVVRHRWPRSAAEDRRLGAAAAVWYAAHEQPGAAILAYRLAGDAASCARLLAAHGPAWVAAGGARTIAEVVDWLPAGERSVPIRTLRGEALLVTGDDDAALAELGALADETADPTGVPPAVAWRLGAVHYRRADPKAAVAAFARGRTGRGPCPDSAMLLALDAASRWMLGDAESCGALAERAVRAADRAGDDRARAAAHVALAMHAMLVGDGAANAAHDDTALRYAEAAGDLVLAARIRINRSGRLLAEARYAETVTEARLAAGLAETTECPAILGVALCNEGDALARLARLDEAEQRYERALAIFQRRRSRKLAYPLIGLGAIHRWCGRHGLARAAYEEAVRVTDEGEQQGLVAALAGLARVLADVDLAEAPRVAARARAVAAGPYVTAALLAAGWVALRAGDPAAATRAADEAAETARRYRDRAGLAEALELSAAAADDPATARHALREAAGTWRVTGAVLDPDRLAVTLAALPGADVATRVAGLVARERLDAAGVPVPAPDQVPPVAIRTLGGFEVSVEGVPVPAPAWRSRKARDLLRILLGQRGRPVARERLVDLLWGNGEDAAKLAHRLSVALSTLRGVLDPGRHAPSDHFVLADGSGVALDVTHVSVDLELFLGEVAYGLRLRERGSAEDARAILASAERRYTGDFLADEPYEDWAGSMREEARAAYLHTTRALADLCRRSGRVDDAVRYLLRLLDHDPYDERGHQDLVATLAEAGRHGESRRARARYVAAMAEIDVAPR
jgi:DNA-binding SARP family transcriptional activator/ATP/maltotriose-dependent transcriptional regulator MalT